MSVILRTEELFRHFGGVIATNNVNVEFSDKQLKSIIGPNGAGKTTLINIITGRLPASSGKVFYKDRDITDKRAHELTKLGICRTFQITSLFFGLTVFENVRISKQVKSGGSLRILSSKSSLKEVDEKAWAILERFDLQGKARVPSRNLAHGDQRLLEIAMALASEPKLLFLDEPTSGMSPAETEHIAQLIKELSKDISVVLIEHDMDVVMNISDEITVLNQGRVIAEGPPDEIQENTMVKEAYLGHK